MEISSSLRSLGPWLVAALLPIPVLAQGGPASSDSNSPQRLLTLETALSEAFTRSPVLLSAKAQVDEARGQLRAARTFPHNPELEVEVADRQAIDQGSTDFRVALSQEVETSGKRRKRTEVAAFEVERLESAVLRERRLLAARVAITFAEATAGSQTAALAETEAELARDLLSVTERRFQAGAATQIDLNLARAFAARSERRAEMAAAVAAEARSLLAEVVGLDPADPPLPTGRLELPEGGISSLEVLVAGALENRADLESLNQSLNAAEARLKLERAIGAPDLGFGVFYEEEEGSDRIFGGGLRISLPFFNRNQGGIAEAAALRERSSAEVASQELTVRREVYSALARYEAARSSATRLAVGVVGNLADSLDLLQRSFAAGKIGLSEILVLRRELIEGSRESIEAETTAWIARTALDLAVGRMPAAVSPPSNDPSDSLDTATQEPSR